MFDRVGVCVVLNMHNYKYMHRHICICVSVQCVYCVRVCFCAVGLYVNRPGSITWQQEGLRHSGTAKGSCISGKPVEVAQFVARPP